MAFVVSLTHCCALFSSPSFDLYPLSHPLSEAATSSAEASDAAVNGVADNRLWCEWHLDHGSLTGERSWILRGDVQCNGCCAVQPVLFISACVVNMRATSLSHVHSEVLSKMSHPS